MSHDPIFLGVVDERASYTMYSFEKNSTSLQKVKYYGGPLEN